MQLHFKTDFIVKHKIHSVIRNILKYAENIYEWLFLILFFCFFFRRTDLPVGQLSWVQKHIQNLNINCDCYSWA